MKYSDLTIRQPRTDHNRRLGPRHRRSASVPCHQLRLAGVRKPFHLFYFLIMLICHRNRENYIHRIGRSGRFGRKGVAINVCTSFLGSIL
jgi:hypothetical protein